MGTGEQHPCFPFYQEVRVWVPTHVLPLVAGSTPGLSSPAVVGVPFWHPRRHRKEEASVCQSLDVDELGMAFLRPELRGSAI